MAYSQASAISCSYIHLRRTGRFRVCRACLGVWDGTALSCGWGPSKKLPRRQKMDRLRLPNRSRKSQLAFQNSKRPEFKPLFPGLRHPTGSRQYQLAFSEFQTAGTGSIVSRTSISQLKSQISTRVLAFQPEFKPFFPGLGLPNRRRKSPLAVYRPE